MPRAKSFEREEAIELAKKVFWKHGYNTLGIRGIEQKTGLGRFAINNQFGGKEGLLLGALEQYLADGDGYILEPLREGQDLSAVEAVIMSLVEEADDSYLPYGCLVLNTVIENSSRPSEKVKERTDEFYAELRSTLRAYFDRLKQSGAILRDVPTSEMVEFVVGATIAINFMNRDAGKVAAGLGFAKSAVRTIRGWAAP
ncbi:MAG: TetR/AcrR family transcriptional regulator [Erythrobacter sp.]|uniref:TetR/AcrR family transcriptional regulator n=1 Tax=Erythrobacter sp. TaxID=1042 RepID=UPI0026287430|nr:TetR/AcrR family transcriptional regulator [Erythrobacter sp.]MDJ0977168.1 TetR/AcrR family transcriptional regulator [Erythrobacter sp.]